MISPLASPFRGGWRNLTPMRARGRGGQNPWTPALLAPYAWYDVHAGGTSSTIADTSGNGRADATYGATTAAPLYLPYTGTAYLHLEAATSGTNSLSCTAPANTASYAAYPLGGGAATTGAASSGAFAFTTAGDWTQVDLLDGSAVVLASFRAADSGQTGHTDAYSVAWTINRGTAGRRSALVAFRSMALLGTNDYIDLPVAAFADMTGQSWSYISVARFHSNPATNARVVSLKNGATFCSISYFSNSSSGFSHFVGAGGTSAATLTLGQAHTLFAGGDGSTAVYHRVNKGSLATSTGTNSDPAAARIGAEAAATSNYVDMEFYALITFDRVLTASEVSLVSDYYRTGV